MGGGSLGPGARGVRGARIGCEELDYGVRIGPRSVLRGDLFLMSGRLQEDLGASRDPKSISLRSTATVGYSPSRDPKRKR
jgi:hypothetical protein